MIVSKIYAYVGRHTKSIHLIEIYDVLLRAALKLGQILIIHYVIPSLRIHRSQYSICIVDLYMQDASKITIVFHFAICIFCFLGCGWMCRLICWEICLQRDNRMIVRGSTLFYSRFYECIRVGLVNCQEDISNLLNSVFWKSEDNFQVKMKRSSGFFFTQ